MLSISLSEASAVVNSRFFLDIHQLVLTNPEVQLLVDFNLVVATLLIHHDVTWLYIQPFGTLVMLVPGYMGEAGYINVTVGFVIGMLGWFYILYEIFAGEAAQMAAEQAPEAVQSAYGTMRWVVTIGWAIYPLGYALGYFVYVDDMGNTTAAASEALNIVYNLADVVNKIAFGLLIWYAATSTSKASAPAAA